MLVRKSIIFVMIQIVYRFRQAQILVRDSVFERQSLIGLAHKKNCRLRVGIKL